MLFGLSLALMGEISFENGAAVQSNFHDYPVVRMSQTPAVAPSIANAVFAATGKRVRELPLSKYFQV